MGGRERELPFAVHSPDVCSVWGWNLSREFSPGLPCGWQEPSAAASSPAPARLAPGCALAGAKQAQWALCAWDKSIFTTKCPVSAWSCDKSPGVLRVEHGF